MNTKILDLIQQRHDFIRNEFLIMLTCPYCRELFGSELMKAYEWLADDLGRIERSK